MKTIFFKILQYSQKNTRVEVSEKPKQMMGDLLDGETWCEKSTAFAFFFVFFVDYNLNLNLLNIFNCAQIDFYFVYYFIHIYVL